MSDPNPSQPGRFISVGTKLISAAFLVLAAATAAIYVGLSSYEHEKIIAAKEQTARASCSLLLRTVAAAVVFEDAAVIKENIALVLRDRELLGVELWQAERNGKLGHSLAAELRGASTATAGAAVVTDLSVERLQEKLVLRGPVLDTDQKIIAYAAFQYSLVAENQAFAQLRRQILFASLALVILIAFLVALAARIWITAPLARLLGAVRQLEAGQAVELGQAFTNDEVGTLASAFSRMAGTVARREADVRKRNADMKRIMDNAAQGFLAVTRAGALLSEHSAVVERWLGPWPQGGTLAQYLARCAPKVAGSIEALWSNISDDILPLELALDQLPNRFRIGESTYSISYRPIEDVEEPGLLVVLSDITPEVEQERAKQEQEELVAIFQRVASDRSGLLQFFEEADRIVRFVLECDGGDFGLLKREVHTLKGNAGFFGQKSIVAVCQAIEARFEEGEQHVSPEDRGALRAAWQRVRDHKKNLLGEGPLTRLEVELDEHEAILELVARRAPHHELESELRSWTLEPARKRLVRLGDQARELARRLGKGEIRVMVESNNLRLHETVLPAFWSSFTHLIRNAVDHGLESPGEREKARKSAVGTLQLRTLIRGDEFVVEVEDDGRGINWKKLAEKARAAGLPASSRSDLVEALFHSGVTTRDDATEISGRGVGMAAVRAACESSGGKVRVQSEPGEGTRFQFSWPRSVLGGSATASGPRLKAIAALP